MVDDRTTLDDFYNQVFNHTQKYWAKRIYDFILKLPEFKSGIKDEKSLYNFNKVLAR